MPAPADTSYSKLVGDELPRLQRIARLLVGNASAADEVVAQTLLRMQPKYRNGSIFDPSAALRRSIVVLSPARRDGASIDWLPDAGDDESLQAAERTVRAVRALPMSRRAVVVLRHYDRLTPVRIGEVLGHRERWVSARLARSLASLRSELGTGDLTETIESRLARDLAIVERAPLPAAGAIVAMAERTRRHGARQRRSVSLVMVTALLVVAGVGVWRNRDSFTSHSTPGTEASGSHTGQSGQTGTDGSTAGTAGSSTTALATTTTVAERMTWTAVPPDPRGVTTGGRVVWNGSEALMVGGHANDGTSRDGVVAYNPANRSWRVVSGGSMPVNDPLVFWTGKHVLVIGNPGGSSVPLAAELDEPTGSWTIGSASPLPFTVGADTTAVWTGHDVLVVVGTATALRYDPAADTWSTMPSPPMYADRGMASVWTGTQWLVWGGTNGAADFAIGARYDAASNAWTALAASPLSGRRFHSVGAVWTGTEMIIDAGSAGGDRTTGNLETALSDGAAYDPATDSWRSIAVGPAHPGFTPVWTGTTMLLFAKGGGFAYYPAADSWGVPFSTTVPHDDTSPLWTGSVVLLLGSYDPGSGGAVLTPSS